MRSSIWSFLQAISVAFLHSWKPVFCSSQVCSWLYGTCSVNKGVYLDCEIIVKKNQGMSCAELFYWCDEKLVACLCQAQKGILSLTCWQCHERPTVRRLWFENGSTQRYGADTEQEMMRSEQAEFILHFAFCDTFFVPVCISLTLPMSIWFYVCFDWLAAKSLAVLPPSNFVLLLSFIVHLRSSLIVASRLNQSTVFLCCGVSPKAHDHKAFF